MDNKTVTSTEFQKRAGVYLDEAAKAPVFITKHDRTSRVLIDIDEYERLLAVSARREKLAAASEDLHGRYGDMLHKLAQ